MARCAARRSRNRTASVLREPDLDGHPSVGSEVSVRRNGLFIAGRKPPGMATQGDRDAWAGEIEHMVYMGPEMPMWVVRWLASLAACIEGKRPLTVAEYEARRGVR